MIVTFENELKRLTVGGFSGAKALEAAKTIQTRSTEINNLIDGDIIDLSNGADAFGLVPFNGRMIAGFLADTDHGPAFVYLTQFARTARACDANGELLKDADGKVIWHKGKGDAYEQYISKPNMAESYLALCDYAKANNKKLKVTIREERCLVRDFATGSYVVNPNYRIYDFNWVDA